MKELLNCAMDIGEQMLICGAEVHRVEDSMRRIFHAFDCRRVDVFIITSSMVVTVHAENGETFSQTRRITDTGTDFERLHALNALSRRICATKMSADEIRASLAEIAKTPVYPLWLECICYAVIAAAFSLFFGGGWIEAVISLGVGLAVRLVILLCDTTVKNKIFAKFAGSLTATALAYLAMRFGFIQGVATVIIGNIMTLIPGIGLTNALRDLFVGDSIAGLLRTIEACITALAIAAGYFVLALTVGGIAI